MSNPNSHFAGVRESMPNPLISHVQVSEDEVLPDRKDVANRKQWFSTAMKADLSANETCLDLRFDIESNRKAISLFEKMGEYRNRLVINKLRSDLSLTESDANILFDDVKRFLALCCSIDHPIAPPRTIDQAWHQFILATKDYFQFCDSYCGRYVHHRPEDPYSEAKDYRAERRQSRELAESVFGALSSNWDESLKGGQCTHNCGTGD